MWWQGVVVGDVAEYAGPYYECDANVRSECCLPIVNAAGHITGASQRESQEYIHDDSMRNYFLKSFKFKTGFWQKNLIFRDEFQFAPSKIPSLAQESLMRRRSSRTCSRLPRSSPWLPRAR